MQQIFENWHRVLFHTDEAMSWETVRSLDRMSLLVLIIRNLCTQGRAPDEVMENLAYTNEILGEVLKKLPIKIPKARFSGTFHARALSCRTVFLSIS